MDSINLIKKFPRKWLVLILLLPVILSAKERLRIFTTAYNRPDFIEKQARTFNAFLQDDYEYIVFNDAPQNDMARNIEQMCQRLHVRCIRVPQNLHARGEAGYRHMDCIRYALNQIGFVHEGIVVMIDSDMFLVKPFSIKNYLQGYDIAAELQGRREGHVEVRYLNPMLVFMNMQTLPNRSSLSFDGNYVEGLACDVGGHTYYYLKNNPEVRQKYFGVLHIGEWKKSFSCQQCTTMSCGDCVQRLKSNNFDDAAIAFINECPDDIEFFLDHHFLHYRSGSNWNNKPASYHEAKTRALNNFLAKIISS